MSKPTFINFEDGYKNGDVFPSSRPNSEYIFLDYDNLTHEQIWDIFHYLKNKRRILDKCKCNSNEFAEYCKNDIMATEAAYQAIAKRNAIKIKKVHFNPPVTVVIWEDGTKTIVRTQGKDTFDPEKGLAMAISKKALGNTSAYYDEFKKWSEPYQEELDILNNIYAKILSSLTYNTHDASKAMKKLTEAITKGVDTEEPKYSEIGE